MNKVELIGQQNQPVELKNGSIWKDKDEELYILIGFPGGYCAASLEYGNTYRGNHNRKEDAIKGLTFVSDSAKISIYPI